MEKNEQNYFHNMTDPLSFDFNTEYHLDLDEKEYYKDMIKEGDIIKKDDYFSSVPMNDNSQQKDFIQNINQINIQTSTTSRVLDYKMNENKEPNDKKAKKNLFIAMKKKKRGTLVRAPTEAARVLERGLHRPHARAPSAGANGRPGARAHKLQTGPWFEGARSR